MKNPYVKTLVFLLALGTCLGAALFLSSPAHSEVTSSSNEPPSSALIAGYQKWTRVNPQPKFVSSRIAIQCAMPSVTQQEMEVNNPHRSKLVVVYVNDIGRAAMMEQKLPHFPQGSIVVKEKLATIASTSPELLTVMRKREPGYDPEQGDWEYMVFDGSAKVLQASGKLEKCQACHLLQKSLDYVSRSYLPADVQEKLK
jgi:hypothetical protein